MPEKFDKIQDPKESVPGGENLPPEEKDKIVGEGQGEAEVEKLEKELSPEIVEKIMEKVEDINADGNAFSVLNIGSTIDDEIFIRNFKRVLTEGLLGTPYDGKEINPQHESMPSTVWAKKTKIYKNSLLSFNITGRIGFDFDEAYDHPIANSYWVEKRQCSVTFIFDISKYKEKELFESHRATNETGVRKFGGIKYGIIDGKVDSEFGFFTFA